MLKRSRMLPPSEVTPPWSKAFRYSSATDLRCSSVMLCLVSVIVFSSEVVVAEICLVSARSTASVLLTVMTIPNLYLSAHLGAVHGHTWARLDVAGSGGHVGWSC